MAMTKSLSIRLYELLKSEFANSSKNLRAFANGKKYSGLKNYYRIYKDSNNDLHLGFIDDTNCFCGRKLMLLACGNKNTYAYGLDSPVDVTEWFIVEYKEKGMCAYTDMRHEWDIEAKESSPDGTKRTCIHCDHSETLHSKMVRKTWWE